jgi:uncharacterized protein
VAEGGSKRCLVAIDAAAGPLLIELDLPSGATIAEALAQARGALPAEHAAAASIDWDNAATGIWGMRRERSAVPRDGDRIELYRPLPADPRQQRRTRARNSRR